MKKITTLLSVALFAFTASSQTLLNEDFENGMPANFTILDVDGNTPNTNVAFINNGWNTIVFTGDPNSWAGSTSWYSPAGTANDWMITPAITLNGDYMLIWKGIAADPSFPDGYEVRLSTTGNAVADFTTTLFSTPGENSAWTVRSEDLSTYNGQTVYLAWRNNSNDKYILGIDDIIVSADSNNVAVVEIRNDKFSNGDNVRVIISNFSVNTLQSVDLNWTNDTGTTVNTQSFTGLNIGAFESDTLTHSTVYNTINIGGNANIKVWTSNPNGVMDSDHTNDTLTKSVFEDLGVRVNKKTLLEEFTTAVCQYCPDGAVVVENILAQNPDVIAVGLHACFGTDAMTIPEASAYCSAFSNAAPTATVDRVLFDGESQVGISRNTWQARADTQAAMGASMSININGSYNASTRQVQATVTTNFVDYQIPGDMSLTLFVVEDSVTGIGSGYNQVNAYNTQVGHPYYNTGNPIVGYVHRHVLRDVYPTNNEWGDNTVFTNKIAPNDQFTKNYTFTLNNAWNADQVSLVAFVSNYDVNDVNNREVLNAEEVKLTNLLVGLDEKEAFSDLSIYPNPFKEQTHVSFSLQKPESVTIELLDITGKLVQSQDLGKLAMGNHMHIVSANKLENGFYFIKITVGEINTTRKVSLIK